MTKRKKNQFLKRFLTVAFALVLVQISLLVFFKSQKESLDFNEAAQQAVDKSPGLTDRRQMQAKLQMAIIAFKKENGKLPASLDELKPKFLAVLPNDPDTKAQFTYRVSGDKFFVGEKTQPGAAVTAVILAADSTPNAETTAYLYNPSGKRDPFRPFDISPKEDNRNKTQLEQFDLGQFKLTAVLSGGSPSATVELSDGKGFIVRKGTKIGLNNGEIIDIQPSKLIILETKIDFTGQKTQNTVELSLRGSEKDPNKKNTR